MKKLIISLFVIITFSLFGMGFIQPEGNGLVSYNHFYNAFMVIIFCGLASVGLIDLFEQVEGVSRR
ncbi:MAG: hypothetical protein KJT03_10075 [Verrucomicrobiae bacterium]|nr:hypothetical protein [Verrucomicrobiae bacterium]